MIAWEMFLVSFYCPNNRYWASFQIRRMILQICSELRKSLKLGLNLTTNLRISAQHSYSKYYPNSLVQNHRQTPDFGPNFRIKVIFKILVQVNFVAFYLELTTKWKLRLVLHYTIDRSNSSQITS